MRTQAIDLGKNAQPGITIEDKMDAGCLKAVDDDIPTVGYQCKLEACEAWDEGSSLSHGVSSQLNGSSPRSKE
jgi:hypothetical protein